MKTEPIKEPQFETELTAAWFSEQEVKEWLTARASLYNIPGLQLKVDTEEPYNFSALTKNAFAVGRTLDEAVEDLRSKLPTPAKLREQVQSLIRQADELTRQATDIEGQAEHLDELRTEGKKSLEKPNIHA